MKKSYLLAALLVSVQPLQASAGEWALGVNVGTVSADIVGDGCNEANQAFRIAVPGVNFQCENEDSDTSLNFNIGYKHDDVWGVEVGYMSLGEYGSILNGDGTGAFILSGTNTLELFTYDVGAFYAAGTATWNIDQKWSLMGRLGIANVDIDAEFNTVLYNESVAEDGVVAIAGMDLGYRFNSSWSMNARYDYVDTNAVDDILSLGVRFHF